MKLESPTPEAIPELRSALLAHYDRRARDLPWRRDRDPYRVLVSEVMLQQTRVETVLGYYGPWLEQFPTVEALAEATEDEVMKAWEGLGYYRRARNLHGAAKVVRERDDFPATADGLRELPGVGEYTAGAVASIAFGEAVPAVDGNVRRVLARLFDEPDPGPAWLRRRAAELLEPGRPGDWNQALMELGATVCTPRSPDCCECPVASWCAARARGTVSERPAPRDRKDVPRARFALGVFERRGRVLVHRRPTEGLLGGLWAFPERRMDGDGGAERPDEAARGIADRFGFSVVGEPRVLDPLRHRFSHLDATYVPVVMGVEDGPLERADAETRCIDTETRWIDTETDASTALPTAQRKVLDAWRASIEAASS